MQWQQILGFYYVVRLGSYSKAAEVTHRTQSAVSQQVQALERTLDCKLLERAGRSQLVATRAGQELYRFCEKMLKEHNNLTERIQQIRDEVERTLVVAGPPDTMSMVLPPYAKRFMASRRDVKLRLIDCPLDDVVRGVRNGEIDIGLGLLTHIPTDLTQLRWKPLDHYMIAHRDHPFWKGPVDLPNIARHPLILPARTEHAQTGGALLAALGNHGLSPHIALETNNVMTSIDHAQAKAGIYFALCSPEMLSDLPGTIRVESIKHLFRSENIGVFYDGKKPLRPRETQFLKTLEIEQ